MNPELIVAAAIAGGSAGLIAGLVAWLLIGRLVLGIWRDVDGLRAQATTELRAEIADLRRRLESERAE